MSDEKKQPSNVVGINRQPVQVKDEKPEPNPYLVETLENMLNQAKNGELTEMLSICYNNEGLYVHGIVVNLAGYDPGFRGHLSELGDTYREMCLEYQWEYEE